MTRKLTVSTLAVAAALGWAMPVAAQTAPAPISAEDIAAMRAQLDTMSQRINALEIQLAAARAQQASAPATAPVAVPAQGQTLAVTGATTAAPAPAPAAAPKVAAKSESSGIKIRGYTQVRYSQIISGDADAPAGQSRLRSVQDSGIAPDTNFTFRRIRLVFQGDAGHGISYYIQPDFAVAVNNQVSGERRENSVQLRDAYVDVALNKSHTLKLRLGQSKVPFGWENLQSSSNRIPLDRTDGINSAIPGERDMGLIAYYTPAHVQEIWDGLAKDGQKLFGNYGAFGLGVFNGQGINRSEKNESVMAVAMGTWPFRLDGLGLDGQVLELGAEVMHNKVKPELRSGGVSATNFEERRIGVHAILYPQPFGFQAEWNWGKGPQFDTGANAIKLRNLNGGYFMGMYRFKLENGGTLIPFARWEYYRGGWKAAVNAPRLETNDVEVGFEWAPVKPIELTLSYARMKRREADERRTGQAEGDVVRAQVQFNY